MLVLKLRTPLAKNQDLRLSFVIFSASNNNTLYNESELYSLVEDYFKAVEGSGIEMKSKEILESIHKLEFANIADFKLIE